MRKEKAYNRRMDSGAVISFVEEVMYLLIVFGIFTIVAMARGRYALVTIIFALYLALLVSLEFPYFDYFLTTHDPHKDAIITIIIFAIFTTLSIVLFRRHIPGDDHETAFAHFTSKLILALLATTLVMAYSYQALPVTELITPGGPLEALFGPEDHFFWWLVLPLGALFFLL